MSNSNEIKISSPSDLYEHLKYLQPNIYVKEKHDEGDTPTIILRLKTYDTHVESGKTGEYTVESEHMVENQAERVEGYLVGDWDSSITGEEIGADVELELCLIPPESEL